MDVLAIVRALKRHWRWTIPIGIGVVAVVLYVAVTTPTRYEATASYVLFSPPAAPTSDEIAADPSLRNVDADNPYARMDQSVVVGIVAKRVNNDPIRARLEAQGADPGYKIRTGGLYGVATPTADIVGTGDSPERAIATATSVGKAFQDDLTSIQNAQQVEETYMVKAEEVEPPATAKAKVSSRLRAIVAVLALGALLLFVVVSIGEAIDNYRRERADRRARFFLPDPGASAGNGNGDSFSGSALVPPPRISTPTNGGDPFGR